ncbi:hypothetical protein MPSI1_003060 [Malassezia psittaci]|uniref:Uncharacterized protein n=1 Tax=Malassezia psittaci TaxID=1821823 RepID=A0AAF0FH15_9BASI|nr:hypothetical protein MPSI1_003060 [Malassezia psittaci]
MAGQSASGREPRIPLAVADAPTQRFYAMALFGGVQVWKFSRIAAALVWNTPKSVWEPTTVFRALLLDFCLVYGLWWLAIPTGSPPIRDTRTGAVMTGAGASQRPLKLFDYVIACLILMTIDVLVLGDATEISGHTSSALITILSPVLSLAGLDPSIHLGLAGGRIRERDVVQPWTHLAGQHTVHLLPYGTASLAPSRSCLCISTGSVTIPVVFHHTVPIAVEYSMTNLETGKISHYTLKSPKLRTRSKHSVVEAMQSDNSPDIPSQGQPLSLQERKGLRAAARQRAADQTDTELVLDLDIKQPGILQLVSVMDKNHNFAQLTDATHAIVVACPEAQILSDTPRDYCLNQEGVLHVAVQGLAPLQLSYDHTTQGNTRRQTLSRLASASDMYDMPHTPIEKQLAIWNQSKSPDKLKFAQASKFNVPVSLDLGNPGVQRFQLSFVSDACGNQVAIRDTAEVRVQSRATAHFDAVQCTGKPQKLLRNSTGITLPIRVQAADDRHSWSAQVQFQPADPSKSPWMRSISLENPQLQVTEPGTYTLSTLHGPVCAGDIGAPWTCEVAEVPYPSADIHFESIEDPCAGTVGVKALSVLQGDPPFRLYYEVQRQGQPARRQVRIVEHRTRDQLEFWPKTEGLVTYRFLALDDANYARVPLDGPSFTQVVHPLADAAFTAPGDAKHAVAHSCGRAEAEAEIALSGHGPWELDYVVRGTNHAPAEHRTVSIDRSPFKLQVNLPQEVSRSDTSATISLERLRDGKKCETRLATRDLQIDLSHLRPTIGFLHSNQTQMRKITVRDGAPVELPVRLTGDSPWQVAYTYQASAEHPTEMFNVTLHSPNDKLEVYAPGIYTLHSISDAHCPGEVLSEQQVFHVAVRPRPSAGFAPSAGRMMPNGTCLRMPVCVHTPDAAPLQLNGHAPITLRYVVDAAKASSDSHTFATSLTNPPLSLVTDQPGWHTYEILDVGDALYTSAGISPAVGAQRLEQMVYPRASAYFATNKKPISFCVGDRFQGAFPRLQLLGTPPFEVHMTLHADAASGMQASDAITSYSFTEVVHKTHYTPHLDTDQFVFGASGRWVLRVDSVKDATHCAAEFDQLPMVQFDVVETAGITPQSARTDYCVGEQIHYVLQGMSPWTIEYTLNGKQQKATSRTSEFVRTADQPGTLVMHSAAHQQNQCRSANQATTAYIHPLPSVRVSSGWHRVESLHRGKEASITFNLQGDAPFAFTYQRTEPVDRVAHPRVLETHTVEKVHGNQYTIHTTQEGTWSVIWIQDRWCQVSLGEASGPASWNSMSITQ